MLSPTKIAALLIISFQTSAETSPAPRFRAGEKLNVVSEDGRSEVTVFCQGISVNVSSPTRVRILDEQVVEWEGAAFYQVRVLEGKQAWTRVLANEKNLKRLDRPEVPKSSVQPDDSQTTVPINSEPTAPRAITLHKMASNLEELGNTQGAIDFYRQVVIQYPDSIPAASARRRIKSLSGKIPSPSEYKPMIDIDASFSRPSYDPRTPVRKQKFYIQQPGYEPSFFYGGLNTYGGGMVHVSGYTRQDGTYVNSYWRSSPHR